MKTDKFSITIEKLDAAMDKEAEKLGPISKKPCQKCDGRGGRYIIHPGGLWGKQEFIPCETCNNGGKDPAAIWM